MADRNEYHRLLWGVNQRRHQTDGDSHKWDYEETTKREQEQENIKFRVNR